MVVPKKLIIYFIIFSHNLIYAQDGSILESIFENYQDIENDNFVLDILDHYRMQKINLFNCKLSELARLPLITTHESYAYLKLLRKYPYLKRTDIADSLEMNEAQKYILLECTKTDSWLRDDISINYRSRLISNNESESNFNNGYYLGDGNDTYNRIMCSYSDVAIGLLNHKNRGEQFKNSFISGYLQYNVLDINLIIGDFLPNYGMGGILWQTFGARKGLDVISPITRIGNGIDTYSSSVESGFFRGIAMEKEIAVFKNSLLRLSFFYSNTYRSATIDSKGYVSSINTSGYYRTITEIEKRNNLNEQALGANIEYYNDLIRFGGNLLYLNYDRFLSSSSSSSFYGKEGILHSYYLGINLNNLNLITELSIDASNNTMFKSGIETTLNKIKLALFYRNIGANFRSPYGYSFGEFSNPSNEEGLYYGLDIKFSRKVSLKSYLDIYNSKDRTFFVPTKVNGLDIFSEISYRFNNINILYIRLRNENKTENINVNTSKSLIGQVSKTSGRFATTTSVTNNLELGLRVEASYLDYYGIKSEETGALFFVEAKWDSHTFYDIGSRFTLFSSDSYASAIWQFEYLSYGYMTNKALSGIGERFYLYTNLKVINNLTIAIRYSISIYNNIERISTQNGNIEGNIQSQIFAQFDYTL